MLSPTAPGPSVASSVKPSWISPGRVCSSLFHLVPRCRVCGRLLFCLLLWTECELSLEGKARPTALRSELTVLLGEGVWAPLL